MNTTNDAETSISLYWRVSRALNGRTRMNVKQALQLLHQAEELTRYRSLGRCRMFLRIQQLRARIIEGEKKHGKAR